MKKMNNLPKSLYIHIPFCSSMCDYCDFTKLQYFSFLADSYITSLIKEIKSYDIPKDLKTIYIGGGTPSVLSLEQLERILSTVDEYSKKVEEFTIEVNPESIDIDKLKLFKKHRVNRISMGVESTNDQILNSINRKHTFDDVKKAVFLIRNEGFTNLSLDLILGLPNVTDSLLENDIKNIISLNPDNVSCYSLTVHENTKFYIKGIKAPEDDTLRNMYDLVHYHLSKNGYEHYEISSWGKNKKYGKHNFTYWRNERYFGVGLGASGYVNNIRYKNTRNLNKYNKMENIIDEKEVVAKKDEIIYEIMLRLRTFEGIDLAQFEQKFGFNLYQNKEKIIQKLIKNGLLLLDEEKKILVATYEGMMVLDQIILDII